MFLIRCSTYTSEDFFNKENASPLGRPKLPWNHQSRFLTPTWFCQALSTSEKMLVSSCRKSLWVIPDCASPVRSYPMSSACSRFKMHLASIPLIHDHSQEPGGASHAPITMATSVSSGSFLSARRSVSHTHHHGHVCIFCPLSAPEVDWPFQRGIQVLFLSVLQTFCFLFHVLCDLHSALCLRGWSLRTGLKSSVPFGFPLGFSSWILGQELGGPPLLNHHEPASLQQRH